MDKWIGFTSGLFCGGLLVWVWYPEVAKWWRHHKMPYAWSCTECLKQNGQFRCRSSNTTSIMQMAEEHMKESHDDS